RVSTPRLTEVPLLVASNQIGGSGVVSDKGKTKHQRAFEERIIEDAAILASLIARLWPNATILCVQPAAPTVVCRECDKESST
ncbi:bhlh transcription factor-like protein, partial [Moniliophthora roreri]